ncbi:MAG: SulP family inorganic anion transporter [Verrucomicrobiaceae bacterium]|nr:SulP family inorganic anion transporter [Verrucomicrobiaceae bacterium]
MKSIPQSVKNKIKPPIELFPILSNIKGYNTSKLADDIRTGFNVAVLSFPVNMAYALVAGLPISYGIFSGILVSIIGLIFCRSIYITFGPSNATAVMLLSTFAAAGMINEAQRMAVLPNILLCVGVFMAFISIFKLTFLISYISRTVIIAHVTSSALLIVVNQMRNLLGFTYQDNAAPISLIDNIITTIKSIDGTQISSVIMASITLAIFFPLKRFAKKLPAEGLTLIAVGVVCFLMCEYTNFDVERLRAITVSEWKLTVPDFTLLPIKETASLSIAITLLAIIEAFSIGKSLASQKADRLDTNQEVFSLGMANATSAFASATIASGSLTRSTLAVNSGAKTTMFNLFTALFTIVAMLLFGEAVSYIPKATLALIVVYTSVTLIKPAVIKVALKSTPSDAIVFLVTFLTGVFSTLDNAIIVGVIISILLFLRKASRPEIVEYEISDSGELEKVKDKTARADPEISIVHVEGNMFFGASDVLQNQIRRIAADPNLKVLILKLRNAINIDATSVLDLEELDRRMKASNRILLVCEIREDIMNILKKSGTVEKIGIDRLFENDENNATLSAAKAIRYAQKFLKDENPKLTIYTTKQISEN